MLVERRSSRATEGPVVGRVETETRSLIVRSGEWVGRVIVVVEGVRSGLEICISNDLSLPPSASGVVLGSGR